MNGDRVVEVGLGGPHFHCYSEALKHLIAANPLHVDANHLLLFVGTNHLHHAFRLPRGHSVIHRGEGGRIDFHIVFAILMDGFIFSEPHCPDRRVAEDHGRDVVVVQPGIFFCPQKVYGRVSGQQRSQLG